MKISVIFVTPQKHAYELIEAKAKALASSDLAKKGYLGQSSPVLSLVGFHLNDEKAFDNLTSRIYSLSQKNDALILIADGQSTMEIVTPFREALHCFKADMTLAHQGRMSENFLRGIVSSAIGEFARFTSFFNDHKYEKILLLPTKIFKMSAFDRLISISKKDVSPDEPIKEIESCIKEIRSTMSPKNYKRFKGMPQYLVDENRLYYEYGHEHHARAETKSPPHNLICALNSRFRFGRKYDDRRHFNVSVERPKTSISGYFTTCHCETSRFSSDTHLNVFPNNYIS